MRAGAHSDAKRSDGHGRDVLKGRAAKLVVRVQHIEPPPGFIRDLTRDDARRHVQIIPQRATAVNVTLIRSGLHLAHELMTPIARDRNEPRKRNPNLAPHRHPRRTLGVQIETRRHEMLTFLRIRLQHAPQRRERRVQISPSAKELTRRLRTGTGRRRGFRHTSSAL